MVIVNQQPGHEERSVGPARVLGDRYELGPVLGEGGMGVVHRAHDNALGRDVAVKLVPASSPRFVSEARRTAAVLHPAVVAIHDVGTDGDDAYLVMELLEGESLDARIARDGPLEAAAALKIGITICEALAAAHAAGIVHRDIKPANVFLLSRGGTKVLDFGIAREVDAATTDSGMLVGTLAFMAPEQVRGDKLDGRTDLHALGGTLYHALAGRPPFAGDNAAVLVRAVLDLPPAPLPASVPGPIAAAVLRLLEKQPRHRPADADAARQLLVEASAGHAPRTRGEFELGPVADGPALELAVVPVRTTPPAPVVLRAPAPVAVVPRDPGPSARLGAISPEVSKRVAAYGAFGLAIDVLFFHGGALTIVPLVVVTAVGVVAYFARRSP